jgi:hypothetical protein
MPISGDVRVREALAALTIGADAAAGLNDSVGTRMVVASFTDATYISGGRRMMVVTSRRVSSGPTYVVVDSDDVAVEMGARVAVHPGRLELGNLQIALGAAALWTGELPDPQSLVAASDLVIDVLAPVARRSEITAAPYARHLGAACAALGQRDFDRIARSIVGLGPGLTPAGDDALAGLLVVAVAVGVLAPGEWTPSAEVAARTNPLSLSFVRLAATGQAIGPVHDVLVAGASGNRGACERAAETLLRVGGTSGADIAFGMRAGLRHLLS